MNGLPWKRTEIILSFLRLLPNTAFWTLVDFEGYFLSSKGFFPQSRYNGHLSQIHPFQSILVHWFVKCQFSVLPSPVLPLPTCLDYGLNIKGSYALLLFTASDLLLSPVTSTTECCFCFGSISSFFMELFLH